MYKVEIEFAERNGLLHDAGAKFEDLQEAKDWIVSTLGSDIHNPYINRIVINGTRCNWINGELCDYYGKPVSTNPVFHEVFAEHAIRIPPFPRNTNSLAYKVADEMAAPLNQEKFIQAWEAI